MSLGSPRTFRPHLRTAALLFCLLAPGGGSGAPALEQGPAYRPGEILVKYREERVAARAHSRLGGRVAQRVAGLRLQRVALPEGLSVEDALHLYAQDPAVEYAEPVYLARKAAVSPDDPLYAAGEQWALAQISAPAAWDYATGGPITVAFLDTGIDYNHPDLRDNLWVNAGEVPGDGVDNDANGYVDDVYGVNFNGAVVTGDPWDDDVADAHGTHLAGIVGAAGGNGTGIAGLNWQVRLMAVKFLHGSAGLGDVADAAAGIVYAVDHGAQVINCSFVISDDPSLAGPIRALNDAIAYADSQGVLVVSAAGNLGRNLDDRKYFPAATRLPNNIAVAATTREETLPAYSNYGARSVDVAAPGGATNYTATGVLSTRSAAAVAKPLGLYATLAGTSIAAPHVAGLAALVWSAAPELTHLQVKARILNGVDPIAALATRTITGGRINAYRSLTLADLPCVFDLSTRLANPGDEVELRGVNFGASAGTVAVGGASMAPVFWSDTRVVARVPLGAPSGRVQVNAQGASFPLTVNQAPTVALEATPSRGAPSLEVVLKAVGSDPEGGLASWEWDLASGTFVPGTAAEVRVTLATAGAHVFRVRVTDELGLSAVGTATVTVEEEGGSGGGAGGGGSAGGGGRGGGCFLTSLRR